MKSSPLKMIPTSGALRLHLIKSTVLLFALLSIGTLPLRAQSGGAPTAFATLRYIENDSLDQELRARLRELGFTGKIESTLERRLGRRVDPTRANLGRLLWFDTIGGLNNDNTCAGCHSPTRGFGDTQSIAIGIGNNGIVRHASVPDALWAGFSGSAPRRAD